MLALGFPYFVFATLTVLLVDLLYSFLPALLLELLQLLNIMYKWCIKEEFCGTYSLCGSVKTLECGC